MNVSKKKKPRSYRQNKSLHMLCQQIADYCVETGITTEVITRNFEVYPSMETIKDMFRQVGKEKFGKNSTANLTTVELQQCYEEVSRHISEITGEYFVWPSEENRLEALQSYNNYL
jgi:hypothetical protein